MQDKRSRLNGFHGACLLLVILFYPRLSVATEAPLAAAYEPTADRVLHYQTARASPLAQRYQIDLFADGTVLYTGLGNVNLLGPRKLTIKPEEVQKIVNMVWAGEKPAGTQSTAK